LARTDRLHGNTPRRRAQQRFSRQNEGRFGRLFPKLAPAPEYPADRLAAAAQLMAETDAPANPTAWGTPDAQPETGDNSSIPAAFTYFGQFVDHDVTFDATSRLGTAADPGALVTFRTPRFDLDSLYGSGPVDEPFQYDQEAEPKGKLLLAQPNGEFDLPRNTQQVALIGDPRNDENTIVSQLQVAFIRFHNRVLEDLAGAGVAPEAVFDEARRSVRWHYQWTVVHDFLKRVCGPELVDDLLEHDPTSGLPDFQLGHYKPLREDEPFMPVEFSAAAFRYGHSQVRAAYALNTTVNNVATFVPRDDVTPTDDLRGNKTLPPQWAVDWALFIELGTGTAPQPSRLVDGKISPPLFDLPRLPAGEQQSLPLRNLQRGQALGLPSGQDVARHLGAPPATGAELGTELDPTPLWLYVLLEAARGGGQRLGPVGARIVAETLLGLLERDPNSYVCEQPGWSPTLPGSSAVDGTFGLADILRHALRM